MGRAYLVEFTRFGLGDDVGEGKEEARGGTEGVVVPGLRKEGGSVQMDWGEQPLEERKNVLLVLELWRD